MKTVILFKCHSIDKKILYEYRAISSSCDPLLYDVIMLYDNSRKDFKPVDGVKYFLFNQEDFKKIGYPLMDKLPKSSILEYMFSKNIQWFHADYPIFIFYKKHPEYQYYWQIEFDVRFNGPWKYFFSHHEKLDSDFLSTYIETREQYPEWNAWGVHNLDVDDEKLRQSIFPLIRLSNHAIKLLDKEFLSGKCGYCEVIIPSILNINNYKIEEIDRKFYNEKTFTSNNVIDTRYNVMKVLHLSRNKLFHPVKGKILASKISKLEIITIQIIGIIGRILKRLTPWIYNALKPYFPDKK